MDQVEQVKSKTDIVQIIGEHLQLRKAGRNFKTNCPFHGEKTPSFMVNPELQIWKCFGCGKGGDVFTFLKEMEGMDFGDALKNLAERAGIKLTSYKQSPGEEEKDRLIHANELAANYYHYLLTKHKLGQEALTYLKQRKISNEAIETFRLGFSPNGWDYLLNFLISKKGYKKEELERINLITKNYDRFRNRLMFPLRNHRGQVVGFAGRILDKSDQAKYINTSETELYHKSELLYGLDVTRGDIKKQGFAVVVEGEVDAIASWQSGVKNVVAIKGSALTEKQVDLVRRYCDTVVLALDGDVAGDAAARRGIEIAIKNGLVVRMVSFKGAEGEVFKDPGEMAIAEPAKWKRVVEEAVPIYDFYIQSAVGRYGTDVIGKKRIGHEVLPVIANIDDEIEKGHYIKKLANILEVEEGDVRRQMGKRQNLESKDRNINSKPTIETKRSRREVLEEYIIYVAIRLQKTTELADIKFFETSFWTKVKEHLEKGGKISELPLELRKKVEELTLREDEPDEKEWKNSVRDLEILNIREEMPKVDTKRLAELSLRLGTLTRSG